MRVRVVAVIAAVVAIAAVAVVVALGGGSGLRPRGDTPSGADATAGSAVRSTAPATATANAATDTDTTPPPGDPSAPVVAFYGDSYTLGTGASDPAKRWSSIICAERGWTEVNPSVNGLGFVNNRPSLPPAYPDGDEVSRVIAADPDIVIVTMGLNDNFSMPKRADQIQAAITADFDRLREALPDARLIAVEPFWYTDARPASVQQIIDWVHDAAVAHGADWIPDASHWIEGHPEWMAADGLHPNDAGYAVMATRMDEALRELGL